MKRTILVFFDGYSCHDRIEEALMKEGFFVLSCNNQISNSFSVILSQSPSYLILLCNGIKEDLITEWIYLVKQHSPYTRIILQPLRKENFKSDFQSIGVAKLLHFPMDIRLIIDFLRGDITDSRVLIEDQGVYSDTPRIENKHPKLSFQENKIMAYLSIGLSSNKILGDKLYLSPHTIKNHKNNILKKLKLKNIQDLYFLARNHFDGRLLL